MDQVQALRNRLNDYTCALADLEKKRDEILVSLFQAQLAPILKYLKKVGIEEEEPPQVLHWEDSYTEVRLRFTCSHSKFWFDLTLRDEKESIDLAHLTGNYGCFNGTFSSEDVPAFLTYLQTHSIQP